jgi:pantoate--beta-alanine ligase
MTVIVEQASGLSRRWADGSPRCVVMTMGALHDGHVALMRAARDVVGPDGRVVVTIFVNPTQFGPSEDFARYPRTFEADLDRCRSAGVDTVFAPSVREVYGDDEGFTESSITIHSGSLGAILEGVTRPDHFRGMLTVVAKLMAMTRPDTALFGEKDYQQLVLIRRMVADLSMPVEVLGIPTVRDADGLAMSSRNRYLSSEERAAALAIPAALEAAAAAAGQGHEAAVAAGRGVLAATEGLVVDYLAVTDPSLGPPPAHGEGRILTAARVGSTRLIDNVPCRLGE